MSLIRRNATGKTDVDLVSIPIKTSFTCRVESIWNVMAHGDARVGKWRGNWRMEWVAGTLHTTSEHGVSSITTADATTSAASSRLNWRPRRFKWTRPFRRKTKSGFCACAITFQAQSTLHLKEQLTVMLPFPWNSCKDFSMGREGLKGSKPSGIPSQ
jgi:hypothetical protein